jgi:peptidoglycan/LPS O-acetylase OafA/YrhL
MTAAPATNKPPAPRYAFLDVARLIAAIGIAWEHTPESPQLGPSAYLGAFAVPFFTLGAVFLLFESLRREPDRPPAAYARARFLRLYLPLLVWSLLYILGRDLKALALHRPLVTPHPAMFLLGSAHHMWFLSFLLIVSLLLFWPARWLARAGAAARIGVAIAAAAIGVTIGYLPLPDTSHMMASQHLAFFLNRSNAAAPAIFLGIASAAIYPLLPPRLVRNTATALVGLAVGVACITIGYLTHARRVGLENGAGAGFFLFALAPWEGAFVSRTATWGKTAYGFYLAHVLVIEGIQSAAVRAHVPSSPRLDLIVFVTAVIATLAFVRLLSRFRATRWLIP